MLARNTFIAICAAVLMATGAQAAPPNLPELQKQVADAERAFAKTMADRDHAAFMSFVSEEAVFLTGPKPLRGKQQVGEFWKRFYDKARPAPFSWEPREVEVLDSGTLALSTGPAYDPQGKVVNTFTSTWRLEAPGVWRIIFDKGDPVCDCASALTAPTAPR